VIVVNDGLGLRERTTKSPNLTFDATKEILYINVLDSATTYNI